VNLSESGVRAQREKVGMVRDLVFAGFEPGEALQMVGLPAVAHTGLPSVHLQCFAGIAESELGVVDVEAQYKDEVD
jgi:hypothetical protein